MFLPPASAAVSIGDETVKAYFPFPRQQLAPEGFKSTRWFQDAAFRGFTQAAPSLDLSSSALDFATKASVTASITFELPYSSSSLPLDTSDIPVESIASHVQYIPNLAELQFEHYKTSFLTEERKSVLSRITRNSSPQFHSFLNSYEMLNEPKVLHMDEGDYLSLLTNVLQAGCKLAELVNDKVAPGLGGWRITTEDVASHTNKDLVVMYKQQVAVALEVRQVKAGESLLRAIEECSPFDRQNVELDCTRSKARDGLRKMALRLDKHKCKLGILSDGASAMIFKLHRPQGATRPIILRSDRFALSSQTSSLIILTANALLSRNDPEIVIEGMTDLPTAFFPSLSSLSESQVLRSALSPPSSGTASLATTSVDKNQIIPLSAISHEERKAAFESEFGIGGVRVVGEGVNQDNRHPYLELETANGYLMLYGDETKWLEGKELIPIAGKFRSENLLEAQHLTVINNFTVFTPTNLQQLTRITPSHGQLTVPTIPPHTSPPSSVLALSSVISRTANSITYTTSIEDLALVVKKLSKSQQVLALQEAHINSSELSDLSDVVPIFFGIFTDKEENYYLIFEYAGISVSFEELSPSECATLYSSLEALHARGIEHGDFEDRNIVVGPGETDKRTIKIIDFGFSSMHECQGKECSELKEARYLLDLSEEI